MLVAKCLLLCGKEEKFMSRIGNKIIVLPAGVSAALENGYMVVNGPKGSLKQEIKAPITAVIADNTITFEKDEKDSTANAKQGLYRALVANMVKGVSDGFTKNLVITGVGYKAQVSSNKLVMNLGFSHPVELIIPEGLTVSCPSVTEIAISGIDKQKVGQFASNIRDIRPVEPYHGYGVRYSDEVVIRKVGKTAGKK